MRSLPRTPRAESNVGRLVADVRTGRFERTMAVGHKVMIGFFATAVGLLVAMTVGIWRRKA